MPLVSFIIPAYNKEHYLGRCLDSILSHNSTDMEIIIVDDGSKDATVAVAKEYAQKDPRIKLIEHPQNKGTYAARETGIMAARGDYIFCVDPDDYIDTSVLDRAEPYLGNTDIIAFNTQVIYKTHTAFWGNAQDIFLMGNDIIEAYASVSVHNWGIYPKYIKTTLAQKALGIINTSEKLTVCEDILLFYTCCMQAKSFRLINAIAYNYCNTDEEGITRISFSVPILLGQISQFGYINSILENLFVHYNIDLKHLDITREQIFHFFHTKMYCIPNLSPFDKRKIVSALCTAVDPVIVYNGLYYHVQRGWLTDWEQKCLRVGRSFRRIAESLLPPGTRRRRFAKNTAKFFYKVLRKVYRLVRKKV